MSEQNPKRESDPSGAMIESAISLIKENVSQYKTNPGVIFNSVEAEVIKGNQHESGGWGHSPANFVLFKAAADRLLEVYRIRSGKAVKRVDHVRAALLEGTKTVLIFPTDKKDPNAIRVRAYGGKIWINLISLLGPNKLAITPGSHERFDIEITTETPVGPALELNLSRVVERRFDSKGTVARAVRESSGPASV